MFITLLGWKVTVTAGLADADAPLLSAAAFFFFLLAPFA